MSHRTSIVLRAADGTAGHAFRVYHRLRDLGCSHDHAQAERQGIEACTERTELPGPYTRYLYTHPDSTTRTP